MIIEDLKEMNGRLCHDLWNVSFLGNDITGLSPRLIFPEKRNKSEMRISEQESRILFCNMLSNYNYYYSIETPTREGYQQKGQRKTSALSDLSLYTYKKSKTKDIVDNNKDDNEKPDDSIYSLEKVANIELKAHQTGPKEIKKDIEKLIREKQTGNWFHTLKNIYGRSLPVLFKKFDDAFNSDDLKGQGIKKDILFCFCIIDKSNRYGLMKVLHFVPHLIGESQTYFKEFFCLTSINKGQTVSEQIDILTEKKNGWLEISNKYKLN